MSNNRYGRARAVSSKVSPTPPQPLVNEAHGDELGAGFSKLWLSGCFSDFTIVVDDLKEFRVHKAVLSIQSPVFTAMFNNEMQEQLTGTAKIPNFSAEAVKQFLAFMYTGRLKDESQVMDILALAALYDVPKLKSMCEEIIKRDVEANAYQVLSLGHLHSSNILKEAAFEVIKKMFPGKLLPDELMENLESIQELIEARDVRDEEVQAAKKNLEKAELKYEDVCHRMNVTKDLQVSSSSSGSDSDDDEQNFHEQEDSVWSDYSD